MPNLAASGIYSIDGIWLQPWQSSTFLSSAQAWIGGDSPTISGERQTEDFKVIGRAEVITQSSGVVHLDEGTLHGFLIERHGLTANAWLKRLDDLVDNQENYSNIWLVTPKLFYQKVELGSLEATPRVMGSGGWEVSLPFREKRYP